MGRRWSSEDISCLKSLAQDYSIQAIAEKMDRTVGGVAFKAHQLGVPVKARSQVGESARVTSIDRQTAYGRTNTSGEKGAI